VITIAGGIADFNLLKEFCASARADAICNASPEFPTLFAGVDQLPDPEFDAALHDDKSSYKDPRVRAVFAMAPALGPAFEKDSLQAIAIPVEIVAGERDTIVPVDSGAESIASEIPGSLLHLPQMSAITFLSTPARKRAKRYWP
jgi:predicted dienelactone hydrolase